jgi:hypothetical protein
MLLALDLEIRQYSGKAASEDTLRRIGTPWGRPTTLTVVWKPKADVMTDEPLLVIVETPSHGGICPGAEIFERIPKAHVEYARKFSHGAPMVWFEEDCAWAAVALAAPELFEDIALERARAIANRFLPHV